MVSGWDDLIYMQDMNPEACLEGNSAGKSLIDIRDGKSYTVAKLNDGKCWMTQNLAIIDKTINSTDSDMESGEFTIPTPNLSSFAPQSQYMPKAYYQAAYGGYYNWYTATAGSGTESFTGNNTSSSICPKGWRLPVSGYDGMSNDFYILASGLTGEQITTMPYNFVYGGRARVSSIEDKDTAGYYWSSTTANGAGDSSWFLTFSTSSTTSSTYGGRYYGMSVRCVAR